MVVRLNVTNEASFAGAQPGHIYHVSVAAVNIIGVGEPRSCVISGEY